MRMVKFTDEFYGDQWINTDGVTVVAKMSGIAAPLGVTATSVYYQTGGPFTVFGHGPEEVSRALEDAVRYS